MAVGLNHHGCEFSDHMTKRSIIQCSISVPRILAIELGDDSRTGSSKTVAGAILSELNFAAQNGAV